MLPITTRFQSEGTYQVEFDDKWLESEEWTLPKYKVDEIDEGTTKVDLVKLRFNLDPKDFDGLKDYLAATYAKFLLGRNVSITVNGAALKPRVFEDWAFPPGFGPRHYHGVIPTEEGRSVKVEVTAGLTRESSPATGEYGVYFYCNNRLIARALKSFDVGFVKGLAGRPHAAISITRVVVDLKGAVRDMPWNSSKSGISQNHPVFVALRTWLVLVVKDWASLARRLEGDWPNRVFRFKRGSIENVDVPDIPHATKSFVPRLPPARPRYLTVVGQANKKITSEKPWTVGLCDSMVAIDLISKQDLEQKNRICLVLLDSTLEIAFKEFLVNETRAKYSDSQLLDIFRTREGVEKRIKKHCKLIRKETWKKIRFYYNLRCKLVHERATVSVTDKEIHDYRGTVQSTLATLFGLKFD